MLSLRRSLRASAFTQALAAALLTTQVVPATAHACGGLWCSLAAPVNQTGERIVFVKHADDRMSAVIEIQYRGPSSKFAWLIPMPGKPEVAVSSTAALDRLDALTAPSYRLELIVEGTCMTGYLGYGGSGGSDGSFGRDEDAGVAGPTGISIVDEGSVGPYDYTTIAVDPSLDEPAQAAIDWFQANGYDLNGVDEEALGPYLADGLNLLAFKLTKSALQSEGAVRPVILTYEGQRPMIPIRPTAVAAEPDMGVLVWVVADARAVPENFKSLILNEALINWFDPYGSYRAVVTRAADEAGGQGFTTELAGRSVLPADFVFSKDEARAVSQLEHDDYDYGLDAILAASDYFRGWEGWRDAVAAAVELPSGVSLDEFAFQPEVYRETANIDPKRFFTALHQKVIDPVVETQTLLTSRPYLTRLFTTMSADEMTIDPVFTFNPDLPALSNQHVATQHIECNPNVTEYEAPWRIELPQGDVVRGVGQQWPLDATMLPASRAIEQLSNAGQGTRLVDNTKKIETAIAEATPAAPARAHAAVVRRAADDDCAVHAPGHARRSTSNGSALAATLALVAIRSAGRRRRRKPASGA